MTQPDVSIIIPMFNESENTLDTHQQIHKAFENSGYSWELVFVSDGSTDNTVEVARRIQAQDARVSVVSYPQNRGRGYAMRCGFASAQGTMFVTIDADLSYHPSYILDLIRCLAENPQVHIAIGSPYMPNGGTEGLDRFRHLLSRSGNIILQLIVNRDIYTWTGIFRAYRRQVIDSLDLQSDGKEIHLEILSRAMAIGYTIKEVPAVLTSRKKGRSKFKFLGTINSHLQFIFTERLILLFWLLGGVTMVIGLIIGLYITYLRFDGTLNPERPLVTILILLLLGGLQLLSFAGIAVQLSILRRELYRIQKQVMLDQHKQLLPFDASSDQN
jgi:dolichol-phosphate mannosyltransferase